MEPADGRFLAVRLGMRMVKGLSNAHAAEVIAARGDRTFGSVDELWRRARVPPAALERLAEADAFQDLGLERRAALWAIRGLRDEALPLFAAADAGRAPRPEIVEPAGSDRADARRPQRGGGLCERRPDAAPAPGGIPARRVCSRAASSPAPIC